MSIRIAVIGAGIMGADHARIVSQSLPGTTLQVVCDMDTARAKAVAERFDAVDVADDPDAVIRRSDVDAVIVASPDSTHSPLSETAIAEGKKVLCEKPLSQSSSECLQVIQREQASGERHVMLGFMRRYDQSYIDMRDALGSGALGRALMMHNFHRNAETPNADFTGAMAITNSAPHEFDVVRHVLACEYTSISAYQPARSDTLVAPVVMVLETDDGQLVTIEINNNAAYGYDVRAELIGEEGSMTTNHVAYTQMHTRLAATKRYEADWRGRYHEAYVRQNRAFVEFVQTGVFPVGAADCWDGYRAAVISEAGVRALQTGAREPVVNAETPELYRA